MNQINPEYERLTPYELAQIATDLLNDAGLSWSGQTREEENFLQGRFERRMQTGAYSRSGESRGRN